MNKRLLGGLISTMLPVCGFSTPAAGSYAGYARPSGNTKGARAQQHKATRYFRRGQVEFVSPSDLPEHQALTLQQGQAVSELVIVDGSVPDKHLFYQHNRPGLAVIEIDATRDGVAQLQAVLGNFENLGALHIVSHADDGVLHLGNTRVTQAILESRLSLLAGLDAALADGADVLFYGCNLAKSSRGKAMLELVSRQAQVNVAASSDPSGNADAGGDWALEVKVGQTDTTSPFSDQALRSFDDVLAINDGTGKTITTSGFPGGYSNTKSYDVDSSGYILSLSTSSVSASALYAGFGYVAASFGGYLTDIEKLYIEFASGETFDIDSIQAYSPAGNNTYVFTASSGSSVTGNGFNLGFATQNLSFTGITKLTISRQDGLDLNGFDIDNLVIKNAASAPDSDGNLTAAGGVTEPVDLNYSVDTVGEAVDLFDFTLSDGGTGDGLAMAVSQVVLNVTGTASDTDRAKVTWRLNGPDATNVTGVYNGGSDTISFSGLSLSVADSGSEVYTVNGYFNDNTGLTHGNTIILSVDGDTDLTVGASGTQMGATSAINNSTGTVITDNISPVVTSVSVPGNSTYTAATNLDFTVNFNENVTVNTGVGTPRLTLTVGATTRYPSYISGSGTSALVFRHTVVSGDEDLNGIALAASIDPNSGTLRDGAGNDVNNTLNSVGSLASVFVDANAPTVAEVTAVTTPGNDSTPDVTISSSEAGTLAVGGSCGSGNEGAIGSGNSTISLTQTDNSTPLASGTYSDCTATVTDSAGNASSALNLSSFVVDITAPAFQNATPSVSATTLSQTTLTVRLNELGTAYYVTVPDGAGAPTSGQVKNGQNGAGAAAFKSGSITVSSAGSDFTAVIMGLASATAYDIYVAAEDGIGNLQASPTRVDFSTLSPDSDGNLTAAGGVTEPVPLNYSVDTVGEAVNLFDFTLSDGGTADGLALAVSQVVLNVSGTASDTDRNKVTWRLNGPDATNVTGVYNGGSDTISFSGLSLSVADSGSEVYTVNGYFNDNTGLTHGNTIILSVDGDTDLTVGASGTQMGATSAINNSTGTVITDNISPVVTSVSVPGNSTYTAATNLDFTVNFNENVTVNTGVGTPRLTLTVGATTRYPSYISGSGTSALVFRHTVVSGDEDLNGIALAASIDPNSGTLRDGAGNDVNNTLNSVGSLASVFVDANAPTVAEVTAVTTPGNDSTPDVTISSSEAGTLAVGGSCGSGNEGAIGSGNSTISLTQTDNSTPLASGTYSDCTATVTDSAGNASNVLTLSSFVLDVTIPSLDTNAGAGLDEGDTGVTVSATELSGSDNLSNAANVSFTLVSAPGNGTLRNAGAALANGNSFTQASVNANAITYDHDGSETLTDNFTFTVSDELGNVNNNGAANFTFSLAIAAVNDPPETKIDADSTNEDNSVMVDVLANDTDVDGSLVPASVTVDGAPANGQTAVNPGTGVITYTPADDFEGMDAFTYTVEDNEGLASASTAVTITVDAQNDPPVAEPDSASTPMATLVAINVAANDTDVDAGDNPDPTTIAVVAAAGNGSAVFNSATNNIDYTPAGSFSGEDTFTYTIDDGIGATSNIATVTVTVADNQSPGVTSVGLPVAATYVTGQALDFTVNYDEIVTVDTAAGTPRLALTIGSSGQSAGYVSGSGTSALLFRYTVQAGDLDDDGIALDPTLDLNLATIRDGADNDASDNLGVIGSLAGVLVDTIAPVLSKVTAVPTPDNNPSPQVTFSSSEAGTLAVGGSCGSGDEGAVIAGNNVIVLTQPDNTTPLAEGQFADCTATITDAAGNASNPLTFTAFEIDLTAPAVTVDALTTTDQTPALSGTVDDVDATLSLTVGGQTVTPTNNQDGTWSLADDTLTALASTVFDVAVTATDAVGNEGSDSSSDELSITTIVVNLSVDKSDGETLVNQDDLLIYTIVALNRGPDDVSGAVVEDLLPPELVNAAWSCVPFGAALCTPNGTGDIQQTVDMPAGDGVVFVLTASLDPVLGVGTVTNTATITAPDGVVDTDGSDDSSSDTNLIEVLFRNDFESSQVIRGAAQRTLRVKRRQLAAQLDPAGSPALLIPAAGSNRAEIFARRSDQGIELRIDRYEQGRWVRGNWTVLDASAIELRR